MTGIIDEGGSDEVRTLPISKPRHVVFLDETIVKLIHVAKLVTFRIDTPDEAAPGESALATVILKDTNDASTKTYKGKGPSIGHALREMLDNVNVDYPLGGEYDEPEPPAA